MSCCVAGDAQYLTEPNAVYLGAKARCFVLITENSGGIEPADIRGEDCNARGDGVHVPALHAVKVFAQFLAVTVKTGELLVEPCVAFAKQDIVRLEQRLECMRRVTEQYRPIYRAHALGFASGPAFPGSDRPSVKKVENRWLSAPSVIAFVKYRLRRIGLGGLPRARFARYDPSSITTS
jgi:hypothetical protein